MRGKERVRDGLNGPPRTSLGRWAKLFELALFPTRCKTCGSLLDEPEEKVLCRTCLAEIVPAACRPVRAAAGSMTGRGIRIFAGIA